MKLGKEADQQSCALIWRFAWKLFLNVENTKKLQMLLCICSAVVTVKRPD